LKGLAIVDKAVDVVEQPLRSSGPYLYFATTVSWCLSRRSITLISGATALTSPRLIASPTIRKAGIKAFELQMGVVDAAVDDPLAENFRDDLANPLGADSLLAGDLVLHPAFAQACEDGLPPLGLGQNVEPPAGFWGLFHAVLASLGKRDDSTLF
jgi:hypothetical protein